MSLTNLSTDQLETRLRTLQEQKELMATFEFYSGEDRVITVDELKAIVAAKPKVSTLKTQIPTFDALTGGVARGELIVISGPTGNGKTQLLTTFTRNFSAQGVACLWFSYEVKDDDLLRRFGDNAPFFCLPKETVNASPRWLEARIWEGKAKHGIEVVFVDHMHYLLTPKDLSTGNPSLMIGQLMRTIKTLALKTDTTIFLVSHMTKTQIDQPPTIMDLRDSSFVGQEADVVAFVWREKMTNGQETEYTDRSFLKVEKNRRTGRLGATKLRMVNGVLAEELNA